MKQLITFFALAYLISWMIWLPLYAPTLGWQGLPIVPFQHALGGFGPMIAGFLTTFLFQGTKGLRAITAKCLQLKPFRLLAIALLSPFLMMLLAMGLSWMIDGQSATWEGLLHSKEFPEFNLLVFGLYNLVFFGFGEEVGWRGYALPRLQSRFNALVSSLLLTVFWAMWHWPLFLYRPGYTSMDMPGIMGWIFSLLTGSILLTWLFNASRGSILIVAVFHATIDIAFTADLKNSNLMNYMGFLITLWGILAIVLMKPQNLANVPRTKE